MSRQIVALLCLIAILNSAVQADPLANPNPFSGKQATPVLEDRAHDYVVVGDKILVHGTSYCGGYGYNPQAPETISRMDFRGDGEELLFSHNPERPRSECNPDKFRSELTADESHVYWISDKGLLRLPVDGAGQEPELVSSEVTVAADAPAAELGQNESTVVVLAEAQNGSRCLHRVTKEDGTVEKLCVGPDARNLQVHGTEILWIEADELLEWTEVGPALVAEEVTQYAVVRDPENPTLSRLLLASGGNLRAELEPGKGVLLDLNFDDGQSIDNQEIVGITAVGENAYVLTSKDVCPAPRICVRGGFDAQVVGVSMAAGTWGETEVLDTAMSLYPASAARNLTSDENNLFWQYEATLMRLSSSTLTRGDVNNDGVEDLSDALAIVNWLFLGEEAPACEGPADTNADGSIDISDASYILAALFLGGPSLSDAPVDCDL